MFSIFKFFPYSLANYDNYCMSLFQVILIQEQSCMNRLIVEEDKDSGITCHVTSSTHGSKTRPNVVLISLCRPIVSFKFKRVSARENVT